VGEEISHGKKARTSPCHLLANADQCDVNTLKQDYQQPLPTIVQQQNQLGALAPAVEHFQKVTASYW